MASSRNASTFGIGRAGIGRVSSVRSHGEFAEQLRRRLRFIAIAALCTVPIFIVFGIWIEHDYWLSVPSRLFTHPPLYGEMIASIPIAVLIAVALSPRRQPSMKVLRAAELWVFGFGGMLYGISFALDLPGNVDSFAPNWMQIATGYVAPPTVMILLYGTFIPNTWQRCARVVSVIALFTLTADAYALYHAHISARLFAGYFGVAAFWLGTASVLSVYGSHRIDVLAHDALAARQLGQYVLREQIGSGGMGEVYLAEHQLLRRPCAVKVIHDAQGLDPTAIARFEREVQATAALTHPNTVQIYDYGRADDGTFFYAMEYLPGEPLNQIIERDGPFDARRAARILAALSGALAEAHARGLIHRDIKPSNVMLCERGGVPDVPKLLDFGLVAGSSVPTDGTLTEAGLLVGTPEFMSPEQCGGAGDVGPASDIYSLGALGYYLLCGESPFAKRGAVQMLAAHLYEDAKPLGQRGVVVPPELAELILQCLAKRPHDRPASAGELRHRLEASALAMV
jgi:hypothetical protein